ANPDRLRPGARLDLPRAVLEPGTAAASGGATAAAAERPRPAPPATPPRASAAAPPLPAPAPQAYVDQLIEGGAGASEAAIPVDEAALAPGQRSFSAEYRVEGRYPPAGGHGLEQGVNLSMRRETLNYGDFYIDDAVRDSRPAAGEIDTGRRNGGRFTIFQQRFPLTQGWLADSALGIVRTPPSALVNSSYRVFLPTSLMSGATTVVSDGKQDVTAYAGHLGQLLGDAVQAFDPTSGNVAGLGYATRAGPWTLGGQAIALRGNAQVADHEGATLA